jgi:AcrR family transcriptional regulator
MEAQGGAGTMPLIMDMSAPPVAEHRLRLLEGMAHAVAVKGYGDTTIADIVREAGVSRRTFYEHFAGKPEAFIALYEAASHNSLKVLQDEIDPRRDWQTQVDQALAAYLACLARDPLLLRTLFVEILGLGAPGLAARRRVNREIAGFMLEVINARQVNPVLRADMAMAVVGGIHELVLQAIEQERASDLLALVAPASALVRAAAQVVKD